LFRGVDKQTKCVGDTRHVTSTIVSKQAFTYTSLNASKHISPRVPFVLTCNIPPSYIAMRGPANAAMDDLIVEPIEEAVALYDSLLKELQKFMVSYLFLSYFSPTSRTSSSCLFFGCLDTLFRAFCRAVLTPSHRKPADPSLRSLMPSSLPRLLLTTASK
jgi:hypothetical protein